jgi:hypothetical protein
VYDLRVKFISVGVFILLTETAAFCCNPAVPIVCQAYARAEAVFVGTLLGVERVDYPKDRIEAKFAVTKIYKGNPEKVEVIRFIGRDNCGPNISKVGERYFVYKEPLSGGVANLTAEYCPTMRDVKYAEDIARQRFPTYSIGGQLYGLTKEELAKVKITITDGSGGVSELRPNYVGSSAGGRTVATYEFIAKKMGDYIVRIALPVKTGVLTSILNTILPAGDPTSTIEYTVTFRANECDYREIELYKPSDDPNPQ